MFLAAEAARVVDNRHIDGQTDRNTKTTTTHAEGYQRIQSQLPNETALYISGSVLIMSSYLEWLKKAQQ